MIRFTANVRNPSQYGEPDNYNHGYSGAYLHTPSWAEAVEFLTRAFDLIPDATIVEIDSYGVPMDGKNIGRYLSTTCFEIVTGDDGSKSVKPLAR